MALQITLEKRDTNKRALEAARSAGKVPGVIYGTDRETVAVAVPGNTFQKLFTQAGSATLIDCVVGSEAPVKALIQDVQVNPVNGMFMHVDFRQINMNVAMRVNVPLSFIGDSVAVRGLGGTMVHTLDEVEIECLPKDLPAHIEVSVAGLATFDDKLSVASITPPPGVTILNAPEDMVAYVEAPRSEEELAALNEAVVGDVSQVEVIKEKKEEKEDAPEGEEKKAGA